MKANVKIVSCFSMKSQTDRELYEQDVCREVDAIKAIQQTIKVTWLSPSEDTMHAVIEWVEV